VKDRDVARKMVYFVDRSTIGVCKHAQLRAARILGVVSDELPRQAAARRRLAERWQALRAAVAASGTFRLQEVASGYCTFTNQTVTACPGT
jgi:L-tryptophan---pyruvate aminotransferase